jgi:hypothetical protein
MLKIGLTSTTLDPLYIRESGDSINLLYNTKVISQRSYFGQPNFAVFGVDKKSFTLKFENLEKTEFESLKIYCVPFVTKEVYCNYYNEHNIENYSGYSFVEMTDITMNYNQTKYSFNLKIYEL